MKSTKRVDKKYPKDFSPLSKRFIESYNNIPNNLKENFLEDFAKAVSIAPRTAEQKAGGWTDVSLWEVRWAEGYNPFKRQSTEGLNVA